jgi:hypothetical protein
MRTSSQIGGWALNPLTGELVLSREAYPLFGFDSAGDSPTCPMVVARMHPDDRDDVGERAERAFRDGTSLEGDRSTKQIAFQLGIGAKTVEAHRTHLMKKLGLHSASEVVRYAISNGIVDL